MAKYSTLKFFDGDSNFDLAGYVFSTSTPSKVVYIDDDDGLAMIFKGSDLKVTDGAIEKGHIESLSFTLDGEVFATYTNIDINAATLSHETFRAFVMDLSGLVTAQNNLVKGTSGGESLFVGGGDDKIYGAGGDDQLFGEDGKDQIFGQGGSDTLDGGGGKDELAGGKDADIFVFRAGYGKDVITDFDADPDGGQDLLAAVFADAIISGKNGNTYLDFGDGDVLTLLGVKKGDIDATDFFGAA